MSFQRKYEASKEYDSCFSGKFITDLDDTITEAQAYHFCKKIHEMMNYLKKANQRLSDKGLVTAHPIRRQMDEAYYALAFLAENVRKIRTTP